MRDDGRLGVSGVAEVRRSQEEFRVQGQLLILPRCWQNLSLQIRKVKSGEGQTPRQKEEELSSPLHPSHPPTSLVLSQVNAPVGCHVDARLAQDQHRGLRVMLEGQAAFRRSWWRKRKRSVVTATGYGIATAFLQARCPSPAPTSPLSPAWGPVSPLTFCLEDHGCWLSGPYYHHPLNPDWCLKVAFGVC